MDKDANFLLSSLLVKNPPSWSQLETRSDVLIANWMNDCRESAVDESDVLSAAFSDPTITVDTTEVAQRLLYLFQKDLLASRVGGAILEQKALRDALFQNDLCFPSFVHKCLSVEWTAAARFSLFALFFVLGGFMMAYWTEFSFMRSSIEVQSAWIRSFVLGLLVDFLVVSPIETVCMHIALPATIIADMHKVQEEALRCSQSFRDELPSVIQHQHHHQHHQHHLPIPNLPSGIHPFGGDHNSAAAASMAHLSSSRRDDETPLSGAVGTEHNNSNDLPRASSLQTSSLRSKNENSNVSSAGEVHDHGQDKRNQSATSYLFVSHRLSAQFLDDLVEARFIRSFKLMLPPGTIFDPPNWKRPVNRLLQHTYSSLQQLQAPPLPRQSRGRGRGRGRGINSSPYALTRMAYHHPSVFGPSLVEICWRLSVENFVRSSLFVQDVTLQLLVTSLVYLLIVVHVALYGRDSLLSVPTVAIPSISVAMISLIAYAATQLMRSSCYSAIPFQPRDRATSSPHQLHGGPRKVLLSKLSNKVVPPVDGLTRTSYDHDILNDIPGFDEEEDWLESYEDEDDGTNSHSSCEDPEGGHLLTFRDVSASSDGDSSHCLDVFETDGADDDDDNHGDDDDDDNANDSVALPKDGGRSLLGLIWKKTFRSDALPPTTTCGESSAPVPMGDDFYNRQQSSGDADDMYGRLSAESYVGDPMDLFSNGDESDMDDMDISSVSSSGSGRTVAMSSDSGDSSIVGHFNSSSSLLDDTPSIAYMPIENRNNSINLPRNKGLVKIDQLTSDEGLMKIDQLTSDEGLIKIDQLTSDEGLMKLDQLTSDVGLMKIDELRSDEGLMKIDQLTSDEGLMKFDQLTSDIGLMKIDELRGDENLMKIDQLTSDEGLMKIDERTSDEGLMKFDQLASDKGLMKIDQLTSHEGLMKIDELSIDEGLILRNMHGDRRNMHGLSLSGKFARPLMLQIDTAVGEARPSSITREARPSSITREARPSSISSEWPPPLPSTAASPVDTSSDNPSASTSSSPLLHAAHPPTPIHSGVKLPPLSMRAGSTPLTRRTATPDRMVAYAPLELKGRVEDSSTVSDACVKGDAIVSIPQHAPMIVTGTDVFRIPESPFSTHRRPIPNRGYRNIQSQVSETDTASRRHRSPSKGNPLVQNGFSGNDRVRTASLHGTGLASIPIANRTVDRNARGQSRAGSRHGRSEAAVANTTSTTTNNSDTYGDGDGDTAMSTFGAAHEHARSTSRRRGSTHDTS